MIWSIKILDSRNNVRQQVDFEGSEKSAKTLANTLHKNFKAVHQEESPEYEKPVRGMRQLPKWQHNW